MGRILARLAAAILVAVAGASGARAADRWQTLAPANGTGTTICNTSGSYYACLALRCGAGRGLEFAFFFNVGDYGDAPVARFSVDGGPTTQIGFVAVDRSREIVAPYDPARHGPLLAAMKAGRSLTFDVGFTHRFSLRGSSAGLDATLDACAGEISGGQLLAGGNPQGAIAPAEFRAEMEAIVAAYRPSGQGIDAAALELPDDLFEVPQFGNFDLSTLTVEPVPGASDYSYPNQTENEAANGRHVTRLRRFVTSPAHAEAIRLLGALNGAVPTPAQASRIAALIDDARALVKQGPAMAAVVETEVRFHQSLANEPAARRQVTDTQLDRMRGSVAQGFLQAARNPRFDADIARHVTAALTEQAAERQRLAGDAACDGRRDDSAIAAVWRRAASVEMAINGPSPRVLGWLRRAALCLASNGERLALMKGRAWLAAAAGDSAALSVALADLGLAALIAGDRDLAARAYRQAFATHVGTGPSPASEPAFLVDFQASSLYVPHHRALRELGLDAELDYFMARNLAHFAAEVGLGTTYGQSTALYTAMQLEGSGRAELADRYYGYLVSEYGGDGGSRRVNPAFIMSMLAGQMIDVERYGEAESLLRRALSIAGDDDRANRSAILIQLARVNDERGDLEAGLEQARLALREIKTHSVAMADYDLEPLRSILSRAELEQGRRDRATETAARDLARTVREVCGQGGNSYALVEAVPITLLLTDPPFADAFLADPVVADYVRCVEGRVAGLPGYTKPLADRLQADSLAHALYLLGAMNERDRAERLLDFLFDPKNWVGALSDRELLARIGGFRPKDSAAVRIAHARLLALDGVIGAYAKAIMGLRWAGRAEWIEPHLGNIARAFDRDYVVGRNRHRAGVGEETHELGVELLSIGQRDLAEAMFRLVLDNPPEDQGDRCLLVEGCEFMALMNDAFGTRAEADEYYALIPNRFTTMYSGASVSASESDELTELAIATGLLHEQAGRYRLALIYFEMAQSGYDRMRGLREPLANLTDIQVAAATARAKHRLGETAAAHELAETVLEPAKGRFGRGVESSDTLVRWSHRLRDIFETYLDTAEAGPDGTMEGSDDAFFALQYLQATRTASTIAKIAERGGGEGETVRRGQDIAIELSDLYSRLLPATGSEARRLLASIERLEGERAALPSSTRREDGERPPPGLQFLSLDQARNRLRQGEAILQAFTGREHAYAWLVTREASLLRRLPETPRQVEALVRELRDAVQLYLDTPLEDHAATSWPVAPFHAPYTSLLAPFAQMLPGVERLYFVPNGAFDSLPPGVLLEQAPPRPEMTAAQIREARLPWLVRRMAVNVLPSVQSLASLGARAPAGARRPFLGVANPDFGQGIRVAAATARSLDDQLIAIPPLPDTETEVKRIAATLDADPAADLLLAGAASETRLAATDLTRYRIINFATHGILAGELRGVDEPALILAMPAQPDERDDGLLRASEIASYRLDADLVILSACNTAGSDGTPGAEGLSGLANAFFYAGARNLVVTHWEIPSAPAVEVATGMIEAFAALGQPDWANALRRSVIAMIDGTGPAEFAHPAAWGAHMVVGASTGG